MQELFAMRRTIVSFDNDNLTAVSAYHLSILLKSSEYRILPMIRNGKVLCKSWISYEMTLRHVKELVALNKYFFGKLHEMLSREKRIRINHTSLAFI